MNLSPTALALDPVFIEHYAQFGVVVTIRVSEEHDAFLLRVAQRQDDDTWNVLTERVEVADLALVATGDDAALEPIFNDADDMIATMQQRHGVRDGAKAIRPMVEVAQS